MFIFASHSADPFLMKDEVKKSIEQGLGFLLPLADRCLVTAYAVSHFAH